MRECILNQFLIFCLRIYIGKLSLTARRLLSLFRTVKMIIPLQRMTSILILTISVFQCVIRTIHCGDLYELSKLVNVGLSDEFAVSNGSACYQACSGSVSAVSYSEYMGVCVKSYCANLILHPDSLWQTYICGKCIGCTVKIRN